MHVSPMFDPPTFDSPMFDNIINFRDVGKTINNYLGQKLIREGLLFRSARPDDASLRDRKILRDDLRIKTVMDLRTKTEHLNQAKKRDACLKIPALVQSNEALAQPVKIPDLSYLEIRITGRAFERHLLSQLSWLSFINLILLFLLGLRMKAIAILGREVMLPRGLIGIAIDTLDHSKGEVAEALHSLLKPAALPMMVHCTQGKDRTGLVVTLILMILGVPLPAVDYDYALSDEGLVSEREARLVEIHEIGLSDAFAFVDPAINRAIENHLWTTYGGLHRYLDSIGFRENHRRSLCELLLC
ncbi:hypothetical protein MAPG_08982 [Magnaporthiopsis poae ATCC 64411]|uniref:Tyrosine specific protein phosphatases domain-containing protein n=1 Tax=Magnaporthiopsis poae (strain ATCC 64411 / 73-15) TaxID=644358 RepID=A0A0C4E8R4_MAGP6|nr:hypothetical protein MAPG_08982 [Magnaporthiopsis poae ATCC 64411]